MGSKRSGGRWSKPNKQTRGGGGGGFGAATRKLGVPAAVRGAKGEDEAPDLAALLASQLAVNAADHERECSVGLTTWPTIAMHSTHARVFPTTASSVQSDSLVSPGNAPFGSRRLVHVTTEPVLAPEACALIVAEAEEVGSRCGWASRYTLQVHVCTLLRTPHVSTITALLDPACAWVYQNRRSLYVHIVLYMYVYMYMYLHIYISTYTNTQIY